MAAKKKEKKQTPKQIEASRTEIIIRVRQDFRLIHRLTNHLVEELFDLEENGVKEERKAAQKIILRAIDRARRETAMDDIRKHLGH